MKTTVEILKAARDLIAKPENWTQGESARDDRGRRVDVYSRRAKCFCSIGAIYRVSSTDEEANRSRKALIDQLPMERRFITTFNDTHSHSEVLDLFSKAISSAEEKQGEAS